MRGCAPRCGGDGGRGRGSCRDLVAHRVAATTGSGCGEPGWGPLRVPAEQDPAMGEERGDQRPAPVWRVSGDMVAEGRGPGGDEAADEGLPGATGASRR